MEDKEQDQDDYQEDHMEAAFTLAREALGAGEVPVGCVMVVEGRVVGRGRNTVNLTKNATRHAEINAIDEIEEAAKQQGVASSSLHPRVSVYCNVEPCIMCAAALAKLGVAAVYFGCSNDKFGGCGSVGPSLLEGRVARVRGGVRAQEAIDLLKGFYDQENPFAPCPKVKGVRVQKTINI